MKKQLIAIVAALLTVGCSTNNKQQADEIAACVDSLFKYIPDHAMPQNAEKYYTKEYYNLLKKAWSVPPPVDGIGDEEFLYYFIEGNDGCEGEHKITHTNTTVNDTIATDVFTYTHPSGTVNTHKMTLAKQNGQWVIADFDSTKALLKTFINNNYVTPDLAFMEVKGRVKSVIYKSKRKAFFDEQGNITKYCTEFSSTHNFNDASFDEVEDNGDVEVQLTRDDKGYITNTYDGPGGSEFFEYDTTFMRLTLRGGGDGGYWSAAKFGFDAEGYPTVSIVESDLGEETETDPVRITYDKTDSHGNWLKRGNEERTIEYYD